MPMAKQVKKNKKKINLNKALIPFIFLAVFLITIFFSYEWVLQDKYLPLTYIGNINVSFLTKAQATQVLESKFSQRKNQKLKLNEGFVIDLATSSAKIDYSVIDSAFLHKGQLQTFVFKSINTPNISFNLGSQFESIAKAVYIAPSDAQIIYNETTTAEGSPSANIRIIDGANGWDLDKKTLEKNIVYFLVYGVFDTKLPLKSILPEITTKKVSQAKKVLEFSENNPVILNFENDQWTIDAKQLLALLDLSSKELLDKDKTTSFLQNIALQIDQPVVEGQFEFNTDTKRVTSFKSSQEGRKLDTDETYQLITRAFNKEKERQVALPVNIIKPKVLTSDINNLGINELIGQGVSRFAGSIPNRIYNVSLTASKINGVLIPPGETFSFNRTVGDITAATGFKQAYVIKGGRTVLDDGGGVCQDSTTVFRAALNAGLPITQRTAHAYRVGYYEQGFPPGLDATVYYPYVDLQFKNDTGKHILLQAYTSGLTLYVNLYGTSDGRVSKMTIPVVKNQTPPPAELRQDDPTLPKGTVKQVDWSAWGANVSFKRTVTRGGETLISETWYSNYKPWQAIYLVGTQ